MFQTNYLGGWTDDCQGNGYWVLYFIFPAFSFCNLFLAVGGCGGPLACVRVESLTSLPLRICMPSNW